MYSIGYISLDVRGTMVPQVPRHGAIYMLIGAIATAAAAYTCACCKIDDTETMHAMQWTSA